MAEGRLGLAARLSFGAAVNGLRMAGVAPPSAHPQKEHKRDRDVEQVQLPHAAPVCRGGVCVWGVGVQSVG